MILIDVDEKALSKAMERIGSGYRSAGREGTDEPGSQAGSTRSHRRREQITAPSHRPISSLKLRRKTPISKITILQAVDKAVRADAIISTNTSSVSITKLAACVSNPGRFIGLHFFNPVPVMKLVEVVRGLQTTDATHDAAIDIAKKLGKTPITVKNMPGFVVNRLLIPMINEAFFALAEGDASADEIDQGMKLGCNHPMGPLALADLIGLDVLLSVMEVLHHELGDDKYRPCPNLREMVEAGYLGRKTGRGVYQYQ